MIKHYIDAGTSWSKIIITSSDKDELNAVASKFKKVKKLDKSSIAVVLPSNKIVDLNIKFDSATGHMVKNHLKRNGKYENELLALALGVKKSVDDLKNATIVDIGSRDTKWIRFENGKYKELDWNNSCGSATGATIEMLCKFYDIKPEKLETQKEKYAVTCGVFAMEKIMDDIAKQNNPEIALSKYIHGIAYNTWNFAQKPEKLYISGGFCLNECFLNSLKLYCKVEPLGRFVLVKGLI